MSSTPKKRIFVLRNNLAFNAGVQGLLEEQEDLEVAGHDFHDTTELFLHLARVQPDVIIVDDGILGAILAELLIFLQSYPGRRMIVMSLKESRIQVFDTKQIEIGQLHDFLAVL